MIDQTEQANRIEDLFEAEQASMATSLGVRDTDKLTFGALLGILKHGRRTILRSGLVALVLATILAFLLPVTYSATASFIPPGSSGQQSSLALLSQLSGLGGSAASSLLGGKSQGDLYVGILKSQTIASYLIEHFNLQKVYKAKKLSEAEKKLARNSTFEVETKSPIVTVTVEDHNATRARDLAEGYLQALENISNQLALTESSQRRLFYEQRLAKEKDDLANAEVAMKSSEEHTGLIAPGGQTASEIQTLAQLRAQITGQEANLASLRNYDSDENPDVVRARSQISSLEDKVQQLQTGTEKEPFGKFSAAQVPGMELEYIRKARDVKYHETLFEILAKQYEAARLDEAKDSPLQVLDHPVVPDSKSGPHRSLIMAIGLLAGLLGGAAWVLSQNEKQTL